MNRISTTIRWPALVLAAAFVAGSAMLEGGKCKFYPDDPLTSDPEGEDASSVENAGAAVLSEKRRRHVDDRRIGTPGGWRVGGLMLIALALLLSTHAALTEAATSMDSVAVALFQDRIAEYVAVRHQSAQWLLLKGVDPDASDGAAFRQALADAIRFARRRAQPGNIFHSAIAPAILRLLRSELAAREPDERRAIFAEVPRVLMLHVNDRYPAGDPVATMPAGLLLLLPPLPPELQYRFLGRTLILLDVDANLVVDVLPYSLPRYP